MSDLVLKGLDGANPLGFLAALGTLRTASLTWPKEPVRMGWGIYDSAWRPYLILETGQGEEEFLERLCETLLLMKDHPVFGFADDLSLTAQLFRAEAETAQTQTTPADRCHADFIAAFGSDCITMDNSDQIEDTALRTMGGAGHQHFLGTMRQLIADTDVNHLQKALFSTWLYDDPVEKHTMRWDPNDDIRYALQWQNPSGDRQRKTGGSMWGANRLAIEGLPLMSTIPKNRKLETVGFSQKKGAGVIWTWPIWEKAVSIDTTRSLLALYELQRKRPDRKKLLKMGIVELFRCQRLTQGKFRNFTPAVPVE